MSASSHHLDRAAAVMQDVQRAIRAHYPEATFATRVAPDGTAYLSAYTYAPNDFAVSDLVAEITVDAFIQHDVKIHVFPRPLPGPAPTPPSAP